MAIIKVKTGGITADAVTDALIADDVVGTEHLTANEVDTAALKADAVTGAQLADDAVNSEHYTDGSIDTAHIADNQVTLAKMAGGTDGNIISFDASGDPVAIATGSDGQVLTSTGAGSPPAFEAIPAGGITVADQWRLSASKSTSNSLSTISANLEQTDTGGQGNLGSSMTESSGVFTFPSTGTWLVMTDATFTNVSNNNAHYLILQHEVTTDNSSFTNTATAYGYFNSLSSTIYNTATVIDMLNVTNTSNVKIKFAVRTAEAAQLDGSTSSNQTSFTFIRLGDST